MSTQPTLPTGPCPRQPDRAGRPAVSARITITDEMIEKGREAREEHYLRVSPVSCTCGWRSDTYIEADGLPRYEAHLVELALEAAAPLIAAQALRDAADKIHVSLQQAHKRAGRTLDPMFSQHDQGLWDGYKNAENWLRTRADRIERGE